MLYAALMIMTLLIAAFTIAWLRSPSLRQHLEEPKYRLLKEGFESTKISTVESETGAS